MHYQRKCRDQSLFAAPQLTRRCCSERFSGPLLFCAGFWDAPDRTVRRSGRMQLPSGDAGHIFGSERTTETMLKGMQCRGSHRAHARSFPNPVGHHVVVPTANVPTVTRAWRRVAPVPRAALDPVRSVSWIIFELSFGCVWRLVNYPDR